MANDDVKLGNPYDTVIVVCGLLSMGIATVYSVMRIGFDDPLLPVAKAVANIEKTRIPVRIRIILA